MIVRAKAAQTPWNLLTNEQKDAVGRLFRGFKQGGPQQLAAPPAPGTQSQKEAVDNPRESKRLRRN